MKHGFVEDIERTGEIKYHENCYLLLIKMISYQISK